MTKTEQFPAMVEARPLGNRAHTRRKLSPMAYVELGQDNGGILLNLGEGGFAVQSALALTSREFRELRFQIPALRGWLTASGRIVWMSDSKKEAGIQFTELPAEARAEIQKWVSEEGTPEKSAERIPLSAMRPAIAPLTDAPSGMFDSPHHAGGEIREQSIGQNARTNARRDEPARTTQAEPVRVAVAEAPPQDFHFTDYSMFAAVPEKEGVWAQAAPRRRWRGAILGALVAALFFGLGATVGRETVDRWVGYLGEWTGGQHMSAPALKVTPPAPPEQLGATKNSSNSDDGDENAKGSAAEQSSPENSVAEGAKSGSAASSIVASNGGKQGAAEPVKPEDPNASSSRAAAGTSGSAAGSTRAAKRSLDTIPREGRYMQPESPSVAGTSILVNAPEPGSPPFYVNLPTEAVSASGAIAISARRSLAILPRSSGASGAERVVVGKLIAHSEPFYPAEARSRGIEGNVELHARVGRTGQVVGVTPVSGPLLLFPAAVAAVREWRYDPTFVNGDPAETLADITIVFRLN